MRPEEHKRIHESVLMKEVLKLAELKDGSRVIDATLDGGGHAEEILKVISPGGKLLGIEKDPEMIEVAKKRLSNFKNNINIEWGAFENIDDIAERNDFLSADVILFDLGVSSYHFDRSDRGFSFRRNELLDMRFDPRQSLTAKDIVNSYSENELESIFKNFGELRFARKMARSIIQERRRGEINNTLQFANLIAGVVPPFHKTSQMARAFQALRIAVNNELGALSSALPRALSVVRAGGRILVISFHSLEDRIVKNFLKNEAQFGHIKIITKKPIIPSKSEVIENQRSRSAKLRAGIKI